MCSASQQPRHTLLTAVQAAALSEGHSSRWQRALSTVSGWLLLQRWSLLTSERHSSERKASLCYSARSITLVSFKAKKNTGSLDISFWFFTHADCTLGGARVSSWGLRSSPGLGQLEGGFKGRGVQPPSYQVWMSQNRNWKHAWGIEEKHYFNQLKMTRKFVRPNDRIHNYKLMTKLSKLCYAMLYYGNGILFYSFLLFSAPEFHRGTTV